jgi:hypothetical protein
MADLPPNADQHAHRDATACCVSLIASRDCKDRHRVVSLMFTNERLLHHFCGHALTKNVRARWRCPGDVSTLSWSWMYACRYMHPDFTTSKRHTWCLVHIARQITLCCSRRWPFDEVGLLYVVVEWGLHRWCTGTWEMVSAVSPETRLRTCVHPLVLPSQNRLILLCFNSI